MSPRLKTTAELLPLAAVIRPVAENSFTSLCFTVSANAGESDVNFYSSQRRVFSLGSSLKFEIKSRRGDEDCFLCSISC